MDGPPKHTPDGALSHWPSYNIALSYPLVATACAKNRAEPGSQTTCRLSSSLQPLARGDLVSIVPGTR